MRIADSHFHSVAMAERGLDPAMILSDLARSGGGPFLDVAITPEDTDRQRELTGAIPGIAYSCGLHPSHTGRDDADDAIDLLCRRLATETFVAVGETGLDWYRRYAPRDRQLSLFRRHLELAVERSLPIIIHNRQADADVLRALEEFRPPAGGIMHCFSSDPEWVEAFVAAGMHISFAGNVTFKRAEALRKAAAIVPAERLLVETDAPFLAPHPYRGRDNHPGFLRHTIDAVATARGESPESVAEQTAGNLARLLRLSGPTAD